VLPSSLQLRAFISALLLLVQVVGLGHVALTRHTVSDTGSIVDVVPLATETHDADEDHLCAGDLELHADAPSDCLVIALWSSPTIVSESASLSWSHQLALVGIAREARAAWQLDALSRAPKASPPQS
jgi:hypothetical protein